MRDECLKRFMHSRGIGFIRIIDRSISNTTWENRMRNRIVVVGLKFVSGIVFLIEK